MNLLIVDDDEMDRMAYSVYLSKSERDYRIHSVSSSTKGLDYCKEHDVDCILLDYNLPDLSGLEFLDELAKNPKKKDIPVIMFTGQGAEDIAVQALKLGAKDYIVKDVISTEILDNAITHVLHSQAKDHNKKIEQEKIKKLAFYDELTGLLNRHSFKEVLEGHLASANRHHSQLCVMFMDLNKFKPVNDTLGHHYGDMLLQQVATNINNAIRKSDIAARFGGDEFVIAMTDIADIESVWNVADKLYEAVSREYVLKDAKASISTSIGIAIYPQDGEHYDELIRNADQAMYSAKKINHSNYCFYNDVIVNDHDQKETSRQALKKALKNKTIGVQYQPTYDLEGQIVSIESLLRINQSDQSFSPTDIFETAKECHLTHDLSQAIMDKALFDYQKILKISKCQPEITLNASTAELLSPEYPVMLKSKIIKYKLDPQKINIEISQDSIHDNKCIITQIKAIKALGVKITIDNFANDQIFLNELKDIMPIDAIKIDMACVHNMTQSEFDINIVKSVMDIAENFNIQFIAKGVEDKKHQALLTKIGCAYFQGYYCQKPGDYKVVLKSINKNEQ